MWAMKRMTASNWEDTMSRKWRWLAASGLAAVVVAGLVEPARAQSSPPSPSTGAPAQPSRDAATGPDIEAAAPPGAEQPTDLPVLYVTGVEVLRTATEPQIDIVRVTGLVASKGWSFPQLVPTSAGKPVDDILDLQLIAVTPDQSQEAEGFVPVSAVLELEPGDPYKGVRVHGSENAIEVKQIPGHTVRTVDVHDCHDCVGKKFVAAGQAQPGQQGIVRQEDLPRELRLVAPSGGIRGTMLNPNRLSLILGDDNTIVDAFWE